jgi:biotin synthase-like enzyme
VLPYIGDIQRRTNNPGCNFCSEQAVQQIGIERQQALRKDGIAKPMEFLKDALIEARVVVIGAPQHDKSNSAAFFEIVKSVPSLLAQSDFKAIPRSKRNVDRA